MSAEQAGRSKRSVVDVPPKGPGHAELVGRPHAVIGLPSTPRRRCNQS